MLVAELTGQRVMADQAARLAAHICPHCRYPVILKRGRKLIAHFAHRPPTDCDWASGETIQHLKAKKVVYDELAARGLRVELEYVVDDRRADVMAWSVQGKPTAIELQHTSISLSELEERAFSYARKDIGQIWIPFLRRKAADADFPDSAGSVRYSTREHERWIHGLHRGGMWVYEPTTKAFRHAALKPSFGYVEATEWGGGYEYYHKRYRTLFLSRPFEISELTFQSLQRRPFSRDRFNWPGGRIGTLVEISAIASSGAALETARLRGFRAIPANAARSDDR